MGVGERETEQECGSTLINSVYFQPHAHVFNRKSKTKLTASTQQNCQKRRKKKKTEYTHG